MAPRRRDKVAHSVVDWCMSRTSFLWPFIVRYYRPLGFVIGPALDWLCEFYSRLGDKAGVPCTCFRCSPDRWVWSDDGAAVSFKRPDGTIDFTFIPQRGAWVMDP